jgi:hypothetical protein
MRRGNHSSKSADETLHNLLESVAKFVFYCGLLAMGIGAGFLVFYYFRLSGGEPITGVENQIELFKKILVPGAVAVGVGALFLYWGEEVLGVLLLIAAGILYFGPGLLSSSNDSASQLSRLAIGGLQTPGLVIGLFGVIAFAYDMYDRVKMRSTLGAKADTIKYGKGLKEEKDIQNVLLGKCWQLPFCRKFVRERCPIYHAKTSCWKERVGCMCEEQVIKNAMEGKTIPRDVLAASQYIPRNNKLTPNQKVERCRTCIIYNEHQKHKYRVALPVVLVGLGATYALGRGTFLDALGSVIVGTQGVVDKAMLRKDSGSLTGSTMLPIFKELILIVIFMMLIAYLLRFIEYLFFKLKV